MYRLPIRITFRQNLKNQLICALERNVKVMDLSSSKDKILLKNCIVVKLRQLKLAKETPAIEDEISYYQNLYEILKADDTETLVATLKDSSFQQDFKTFNEHILFTPAKEIAQEYVDLTKSLMIENGVYSEEKFEELKNAFYQENENLKPSIEQTTEYMKFSLDKLKSLIRKSTPKTMSAYEFKKFASQFRDITKLLGISKFQQYFDENGQKITDMQISYDDFKSIYRTDFSLSDADFKEKHLTITEPARFISTYYQNLCYSYLEADKFSKMDEFLLNREIIIDQMKIFSDCYTKLDDMSRYKINLSSDDNHTKIIFSALTNSAHSKELEYLEAYAEEEREIV